MNLDIIPLLFKLKMLFISENQGLTKVLHFLNIIFITKWIKIIYLFSLIEFYTCKCKCTSDFLCPVPVISVHYTTFMKSKFCCTFWIGFLNEI